MLYYNNMTIQTFTHPETKPGETFFTNANTPGYLEMEWISKRRGRIAYDGEGNPLTAKDWSPVFISEAELAESGVNLQTLRREFNKN